MPRNAPEAVSGRFGGGTSGSLRVTGSPRSDDRGLPRGMGRVETGSLAEKRWRGLQ